MLNDPFGRVSRRNEAHYASLRDMLKSSGVDSVAAAQTCQRDMMRRIRNTAIAVVVIAVALALLLPAYQGPILVVGFMGLVWIFTTGWRWKTLIQRYIHQELKPS